MNRDKNLLRLLLQRMRDGVEPQDLSEYPEGIRRFHGAYLIDEEYVVGIVSRGPLGECNGFIMQRLTEKGYDLLEQLEAASHSTTPIEQESSMKRDKNLLRLLLEHVRDGGEPEGLSRYTKEQQGFHAALLVHEGFVEGAIAPAPSGEWTGAALNNLTSKGYDYLESLEATEAPTTPKITPAVMKLAIFISHSSKDAEVAEALINLLRMALNLSDSEIRCTSVNGYRLPGGASHDETLKREVRETQVLIGLITPESMKSAYVLFELGARWGAGLYFAPVLACGADASYLKGPIGGFNALRCDDEDQMHQLVHELAERLNKRANGPASYGKALRQLQQLAARSAEHSVAEPLPSVISGPKKTLPEMEHAALRYAAKQDQSFTLGNVLAALNLRKIEALAVVEKLEDRGFIEPEFGFHRGGPTRYQLTKEGREYVVDQRLI